MARTTTITLGGDLTLNQSGSGASLRNLGTITVGAGRTFTVNGGEFHQDVGIVNGEPMLDLCYEEDSSAAVDIASNPMYAKKTIAAPW